MSEPITERHRLALIAHHARELGQLLKGPLPDLNFHLMNIYGLNSSLLCDAAQAIEDGFNLNEKEKPK